MALSGRALAQAARRAGLRPLVIDLFGDRDMLAAAELAAVAPCDRHLRFLPDPLLQLAARLAPPPIPLLWGSGLEAAPSLLARLQAGRTPLGTPAVSVARCKDPRGFADLMAALAIPHPETASRSPADPDGWLAKAIGGSGGSHVRPAFGCKTRPDRYFQRRVPGRPVSALLLCGTDRAAVLGWSEQWIEQHAGGRRRFVGLVAPLDPPARFLAAMAEAATASAARLGVRGLASADFLLNREGFHLLEINPRPGASLEVFQHLMTQPLLRLHADPDAALAAPLPTPMPDRAVASRIVFARRSLRLADICWPEWAADRGHPQSRVGPGQPVCTVLACASTTAKAAHAARERSRHIVAWLRRKADTTTGDFINARRTARENSSRAAT